MRPLSLAELKRLDCSEAYERARELGYVRTLPEYREALAAARLEACLRAAQSYAAARS